MDSFLLSDKRIQDFLSIIDKNHFMSSKEISNFFNNKELSHNNHSSCCQWDSFLDQYFFKKDYNMLFHDLVGHITLKNNISSKGEILATAGMCGFSFELGKFYFINAILIFSLGYKLFDGTRSDYSNIGEYIDEMNIAYDNGQKLRAYLNFNETLLNEISIEEFLLANCEKLKRFKI
jgi:hypothetical protein